MRRGGEICLTDVKRKMYKSSKHEQIMTQVYRNYAHQMLQKREQKKQPPSAQGVAFYNSAALQCVPRPLKSHIDH